MGCALAAFSKDNRMQRRGTTILELTVAVAIMVTVLTAVMPLFAGIRRSSETHWTGLEMLQDARVLNGYLHRNLATARRVMAVSGPADRRGHIEFEAGDGELRRLEVDDRGHVVVGLNGRLHELIGPVEYVRFVCYDRTAGGEPTCRTDAIRLVTWEAGLSSSVPHVEPPTVRGACCLRVDVPAASRRSEGRAP